jgi:DNA (cytosine-5)-methyltransferase 1
LNASGKPARLPHSVSERSYTRAVSRQLRLIDLFAGCGGLTHGFVTAGGFRVVAAVESDPVAASTYAANFGMGHVHVEDLKHWVLGHVPRADVVIGGPPCQGFSNLGTRNARDPRNALWRRYVEVLEEARPLYFVLENVPAFLKSGQFTGLTNATRPSGPLSAYRIEHAVVNAADFGAAQLRSRALVIGSRRTLPAPGIPVGRLSGRRDKYVTLTQRLADAAPEVVDVDLPASTVDLVGLTVPGPFKTRDLHLTRRPTELSLERFQHIPPGGNRHDLPDHLLTPCWRKHKTGSHDVMGRLRWEQPSVTIRTEFYKPEKGRYLHPDADRPLTHYEAARLQGFPEDYLWCGSKTAIARQIGNAVPVELSTALARHLLKQFAHR